MRTRSLKNIAPEPQSIFSKNEKLFVWKKLTKSKTPGLSFSSKRDLVFFRLLVKKKKVRNRDLDCVQENLKAQKRLSSIHKVSQSEQVILFDALSPDQLLK